MRYQKIHSQIWNDEKFTKLTPTQQRLFLYILTCPHGNIIGMFVLKQGYIIDDLKYSPKDLKKDLEKLVTEKVIDYDFSTSVVLVKKFLKHNPLTNPNQVKAAKKMLFELPKTQLIHNFIEVLPEVLKEGFKQVLLKPEYISVSVSVSDSDSEEGDAKVKKEKSIQNVIPPEKQWVIDYCKQRNNGVNAETWYDHYLTNGWKVGKAATPMKDWQAAVRTWETNGYGKKIIQPPPPTPAPDKNDDPWKGYEP